MAADRRSGQVLPADGGNGQPSVGLQPEERSILQAMAERLASDPNEDPTTGADLGAGPGAGKTKSVDGQQAST